MRVSRATSRRKGLTSVAVLVCLLVVGLISGALLKVGLAHRVQIREQERNLQAEWLTESAIERASARLEQSPDYTGETWTLRASDLGLPEPAGSIAGAAAEVVIKVERLAGSETRRLVKVQADLSPGGPRRIRQSRNIVVELASPRTGVAQ